MPQREAWPGGSRPTRLFTLGRSLMVTGEGMEESRRRLLHGEAEKEEAKGEEEEEEERE